MPRRAPHPSLSQPDEAMRDAGEGRRASGAEQAEERVEEGTKRAVQFSLAAPSDAHQERTTQMSYASGASATTVQEYGGYRGSERFSGRSTMHNMATAISRSPKVATNAFLDNCCRRKSWQLIVSILCGVVAVYVHSSSSFSAWLFGKDWNESWLWWCIAVPMYVYLAIYFTRYLGSYLARTWLREISESPIIHRALVTLVKGIFEEPEFGETLAGFLDQDIVVDSVASLTAAILSSSGVHHAAAGATASVLTDRHVLEATIEASTTAMRDEKLLAGVEELMGRKEFASPLAEQVARLMDDQQVHEAAAGLVHELLEDTSIKEVLHRRAASLIGDAALVEAGRKGLVGAMFGKRGQDQQASAAGSRSRASSTPTAR